MQDLQPYLELQQEARQLRASTPRRQEEPISAGCAASLFLLIALLLATGPAAPSRMTASLRSRSRLPLHGRKVIRAIGLDAR